MNEVAPKGAVPLAAAIAALRSELTQAWWDAQNQSLRFKVAPVELTLEAAVTYTSKGVAGVKWWLIELGGELARESAVTQTVKLTLDPVTFGPDGQVQTVFIDASDDALPAPWSQEDDAGLDAAG